MQRGVGGAGGTWPHAVDAMLLMAHHVLAAESGDDDVKLAHIRVAVVSFFARGEGGGVAILRARWTERIAVRIATPIMERPLLIALRACSLFFRFFLHLACCSRCGG